MDASIELSDSDSGETWTVLEHSLIANDVPQFTEVSFADGYGSNVTDSDPFQDEDTDGISIISDSESESLVPEHSKTKDYVQNSQNNQHVSEFISLKSAINNNLLYDVNEDFLGNNNSTHKTYVHKRNERLSTVLNVIVLGTVITASGVAIGHMWGVKNDCPDSQTTQSLNKILSNLYKLQEENAYLRSKLKEMILMNNIDVETRKSGTESISKKRNICKKMFEDSIYTKNTETPIKCVDNEKRNKIDEHLIDTHNDIEFLNDIQKTLDHDQYLNNLKNKPFMQHDNVQISKIEKIKGECPKHSTESKFKIKYDINDPEHTHSKENHIIPEFKTHDTNIMNDKKKYNAASDGKITKANKYYKKTQDRKKYWKKKQHKKKKINNYKWEHNDYLTNYDNDVISKQQKIYYFEKLDSNISKYNIEQSYAHGSKEIIKNICNRDLEKNCIEQENNKKDRKISEDIITWFDKRANSRNEARKKLELDTFGKTNLSSAGWYFQSMRGREKFRAKDTYKKISKRENINV